MQPFFELASLPLAIGQLVIEWSHVERNLLRVMTMLGHSPPRKLSDSEYAAARKRWLGKNFDEWEKELAKIARLHAQKHFVADIEKIIAAFPIALRRRHDVVHGYYGGLANDGHREYKRQPRNGEQSEAMISSHDVWNWTGDIRSLLAAVGEIEIKINKGEVD